MKSEVKVGDRVRSHDFPHMGMDESGDNANYAEGNVVAVHLEGVAGVGRHPMYEVDVERVVRAGNEVPVGELKTVYPPMNGLESFLGVTHGVEVVEAS